MVEEENTYCVFLTAWGIDLALSGLAPYVLILFRLEPITSSVGSSGVNIGNRHNAD